jgi:PAS domain S-box-containing protein
MLIRTTHGSLILARYAFAVFAVVVASLLRSVLTPALGEGVPFTLYFPTVVLSAWFGGLWPALLAAALSGLIAWYVFIPPHYSLAFSDPTAPGQLIVFFLSSMLVSLLAASLHRAKTKAQEGEAREREHRERFRVTLASIGDAVMVTDAEGRVTFMNAVAESLTRWKHDDAAGLPLEQIFTIVNERTREAVGNPALRAIQIGAIVGLANHTVLITKDGVELPIDDSGSAIKDVDGRVLGAVLIFRDITERRQVERERSARLQKERQTRIGLERTTETLRHVQSITDTALLNLGSDDLVRTLLARTRAALASDTATMLLLDPDGRELVVAASDGLLEEVDEGTRIPLGGGVAGRIAATEHGLVIDDLSEVEVESRLLREKVKSLVGAPLRTEAGLIGVIHAGAVTVRRFTEADLELLRIVAGRIAFSLERTRLYHAERTARAVAEAARAEAEAANRTKDEFLAMLSHELRTPLATILGWARTLRTRQIPSDRVEDALASIERNAQLQARLVDDLLDVSRIVSGKLTLDTQPIQLATIVDAALESVRGPAEASRIQVTLDIDRAVPPLGGDPARLQQVVWNLLSNAIKFTERGGRIDVHMREVDRSVELIVQDTGRGIRPDLLPHVFDRFRQGEPSSSRATGGLGLGLTIVRYLVERHGGTVQAASPGEGQGATFTVRLPLGQTPSDGGETSAIKSDTQAPPSTTAALDGVRILIVDDEPDTLAMLGVVLTAAHAEVRTAHSVKDARDILEKFPVDAMISDISMAGEDGHALIRHVRATETLPRQLFALALTARAGEEDRVRALAAGFDGYVAKPVDPADLIGTIARAAGCR